LIDQGIDMSKLHDAFQALAAIARARLESRFLPLHLSLLAMLLCAPALSVGWMLDDDFHRAALTQPDLPMLSRTPAELFTFIEGDEAVNTSSIAIGFLPWWANEKLRLAFFRPVTGYTHWLDFKLWPESPALMHLQSLLWLAAAAAAAVFFYRRLFGSAWPAWVAGMAALLVAVDDAHSLPAVWLANRNALIGFFFGLLTLVAHDRWRRGGRWSGAILAPLAFALGLLSKESTVAIAGYLFAYALFVDRGRWIARALSLVPCAVIGAAWWAYYKGQGYGTAGSGFYVDPGTDLPGYVNAVIERAPNLLAWQWLVPADLRWDLSPETASALWLVAVGFVVFAALMAIPLLRRDRLARFFGLGMLLSLLPACTTYPSDRLLLFAGIGGMGLIAQLIAVAVRKAERLSMPAWRRAPAVLLGLVLIASHLVAAPWTVVRVANSIESFGDSVAKANESLPSDKAVRVQTILIASTPSFATLSYCALARILEDEPQVSRSLVLGSGGNPITVSRPDARTLLVRPNGGFMAGPGGRPPGSELKMLLFNQRVMFFALDRLYRDAAPMEKGQQVSVLGMTVEVTDVTADGRPAEAAFRFMTKLENPYFRWLQWEGEAFAPFEPPAVGQTKTIDAATVFVGGA
jgi:hypothetical protein